MKITRKLLLFVLCIVGVCLFSGCFDKPHSHTLTKVDAHPATCTTDGTIEYYKCDGCKDLFLDKDGAKKVTDITVKAKGHSLVWTTTDATCTSKGSKVGKCSNCNYTETVEIPLKEHNYSFWVTTQENCSEKGTKTRTCKDCTHSETVEVEAGSHIYGNWNDIKEATCTEDGSRTRVCLSCGYIENEAVEALGHNLKHIEEVSPTCALTGVKDHYHCDRCNIDFDDSEAKIPSTDLTLGIIDHIYEDGKCNMCDMLEPKTHYLRGLIPSIFNESYTLKLENVAIPEAGYVFELTEAYVVVGESLELYGTVKLIYLDESGEEAFPNVNYLTIKDNNIYLITVGEQHYLNDEDGVYYLDKAIEYRILPIDSSESIIETINVAVNVLKAAEKLERILMQETINEYVLKATDFVIEGLFDKTVLGDVTTYKLSKTKLLALNEKLYTMNLGQIVDGLFGEGTYDNLDELLIRLIETKFSSYVAMLNEKGITLELIETTLDEIFDVLTNETFKEAVGMSLTEMYDQIKDLSIKDLLMQDETFDYEAFKGNLVNALGQLKGYTLYQLIENTTEGITKEQMKETVDNVIGLIGEQIIVSFDLGKDGTLVGGVISVDLPIISFRFEYALGKVLVTDYDDLIEKAKNALKEEYIDMIGNYLKETGYYDYNSETNVLTSKPEEILTMFKSEYFNNVGYVGCEITRTYSQEITLSDISVVTLCGDKVLIKLDLRMDPTIVTAEMKYTDANGYPRDLTEEEYPYIYEEMLNNMGNSWVTCELVYDAKSNKIEEIEEPLIKSHNFVLDESKSVMASGCEGTSRYVYVCSDCGCVMNKIVVEEHQMKRVFEFAGISCEDGVSSYQVCTKCGEETEGYEFDYHSSYGYSVELTLENGEELYCSFNYCPCFDSSGNNIYGYERYDIDENLSNYTIYNGDFDKFVIRVERSITPIGNCQAEVKYTGYYNYETSLKTYDFQFDLHSLVIPYHQEVEDIVICDSDDFFNGSCFEILHKCSACQKEGYTKNAYFNIIEINYNNVKINVNTINYNQCWIEECDNAIEIQFNEKMNYIFYVGDVSLILDYQIRDLENCRKEVDIIAYLNANIDEEGNVTYGSSEVIYTSHYIMHDALVTNIQAKHDCYEGWDVELHCEACGLDYHHHNEQHQSFKVGRSFEEGFGEVSLYMCPCKQYYELNFDNFEGYSERISDDENILVETYYYGDYRVHVRMYFTENIITKAEVIRDYMLDDADLFTKTYENTIVIYE